MNVGNIILQPRRKEQHKNNHNNDHTNNHFMNDHANVNGTKRNLEVEFMKFFVLIAKSLDCARVVWMVCHVFTI